MYGSTFPALTAPTPATPRQRLVHPSSSLMKGRAMSHGSTDMDAPPGKPEPVPVRAVASWRNLLIKWVLEQSVPTVLLTSLLAASVYGIPNYVLPAINAGYEKHAAGFRESIENQAAHHEKQIQLILDAHERDRAAFERAITILERRSPGS